MARKASRARKTTVKTTAPVVEQVPQAHGGALNTGGTPGNAGGSGRPSSELRERLRGTFAERVAVIEEIADGKPTQHAKFPLVALLPYVACPNCGELGLVPKDAKDVLQEIDITVSASPKDRLSALDLAGKYGLGTLKEVSVENVRERMRKTLAVLSKHVSEAQYAALVTEIRPLWA